jgi:hypothetical protein
MCATTTRRFIKYNHLAASLLAFHNVVAMTNAARRMEAEGLEARGMRGGNTRRQYHYVVSERVDAVEKVVCAHQTVSEGDLKCLPGRQRWL